MGGWEDASGGKGEIENADVVFYLLSCLSLIRSVLFCFFCLFCHLALFFALIILVLFLKVLREPTQYATGDLHQKCSGRLCRSDAGGRTKLVMFLRLLAAFSRKLFKDYLSICMLVELHRTPYTL